VEKISGIIPKSARVSAVDMKEASPVRPGTPSFGRPEGVSSLREPMKQDAVQRGSSALQEANDWKSKDMRHAALAHEVSTRFFINRGRDMGGAPAGAESGASEMSVGGARSMSSSAMSLPVQSKPSGFKTDEVGSFRSTSSPSFGAVAAQDADDEVTLEQPEGLYPKGSFIDRTA
jgi:hypothetical protein